MTPLPAEALAVYEPYGLRYTDGVLTYNWQDVRCFTDTGLAGPYAPGTYLQNYHGDTDIYAVRDENGALLGLLYAFEDEEYYQANTAAIERTYARQNLPLPTPLPTEEPVLVDNGYEWGPEDTPLAPVLTPAPDAELVAPTSEELRAYEAYGLTIGEDGTLYYMGSSVRYFADTAAGLVLAQESGGTDVYALRDETGALIGLRPSTWDEFEQRSAILYGEEPEDRDVSIPFGRYCESWNANRETLAHYEPFGLAWVEEMPVYLGVPIRCIIDSHAQEYPWIISALHGNTDVFALRDESGNLVGLRAATQEEFYENTARFWQDHLSASVREGTTMEQANGYYHATPASWPNAAVETLDAAVEAYAPYGLRVENGIPFYWDVAVRFFVDEGASLDLMCYYWGEVDVCAVRDEAGALVGLRAVTRDEFEQKTTASWEALANDYASPETANMAYNWDWSDELYSDADMVPVSLYEPYGLGMYDARLYYGLTPVRNFFDEALGVDTSGPSDGIDIYAVRDANGELTGLRRATADEYAANTSDGSDW